jgi:hypothetical protein
MRSAFVFMGENAQQKQALSKACFCIAAACLLQLGHFTAAGFYGIFSTKSIQVAEYFIVQILFTVIVNEVFAVKARGFSVQKAQRKLLRARIKLRAISGNLSVAAKIHIFLLSANGFYAVILTAAENSIQENNANSAVRRRKAGVLLQKKAFKKHDKKADFAGFSKPFML